MPALAEQFADAKKNIEPKQQDVKNASKAHGAVRDALEKSDELVEMAVDTILIGSYARNVSIHRMRDVDVFSKLPDISGRVSPSALLAAFEELLDEEFGKSNIERQARSIKVELSDYDLSVDAVPARPCGNHWEIPTKSGAWEETHPIKVGELTTAMNDAADGHYVPTVKLLRQVRRAQLGNSQPGGFYVEIAAYHSFDAGIKEDGASGYFVAALRGVANQLADAVAGGLEDPTLQGKTIETRATEAELRDAASVFSNLADDARDAFGSEDPCPAAKTFRDILGKNADGEWVFPMPSYCNDDGTAKSETTAIAAGSSQIRGGDSRYA